MNSTLKNKDIQAWYPIRQKWRHRLGICNRVKAGYSCSGKNCQ